ncbi:MAG: FRG domain-containing protein, partial [Bacteroidetes bacterium]|nr:FRG domain-containing protein [Bacteroidota bacterium]
MSLTELIKLLKTEYHQSPIEATIFDFEKTQDVKSPEPKYFFRGENRIYEKTNTTLSRLFEKQIFNQYELCEFYSSHFHLYLFLREALWNVSVVEKKNHKNPFIEIAIAGVLQHYGFDTSFLDLTSNIEIAANFAAMNKAGSQGSILVIESYGLN